MSGFPLVARLSNADAFDFEGDLRYYLRPEGPIRTYVAGAAGLRFLQARGVTLGVVEVGLTLDDLPYFEGSALLIFGGDAGVSYDVSDTFYAGVELGLRYQGKPPPNRSLRIKLPAGQRTGQPLVAANQHLRDSEVLMQAHIRHPPFFFRPRMTRLRPQWCGRAAASLVALAVSVPGWAAPRSPDRRPRFRVAAGRTGCRHPSAQVRRQALRALRERGGPERYPCSPGFSAMPRPTS